MPTFATPAARLSAVKRIGVGIRLTETATVEIVASLPEGFDPKVTGAVTAAIHFWATGCECPSGRGKVCQCGKREAVKRGKETTDYGRGVDTLSQSVRTALKAKDGATPDYLALVRQAAETARTKGEVSPDAIVKAVLAWSEDLLKNDA